MDVRRRIGLVAAAAIAAWVGLPRIVFACSCMSSGPPCQDFFASDAVFVGTVTAIVNRESRVKETPFERRVVTLSVQRAARGVNAASVDVWTGQGGGDCGFDFKMGERYVVYARKLPDGTLHTGICSRTRLLSDAAEDVAYLDALPASASGGTVSGTIAHFDPRDPSVPMKRTPVGDVQVLVRGPSGVFSGMTDSQGRYAIARVPPGAYQFEVLPPPGFSRRFLGGRFELKDPRACFVQDFGLRFDGRVSGTLVEPSGKPAGGIQVDIAPPELQASILLDSRATSDAAGHFELIDVPPGRYVVGVGLSSGIEPTVFYARTLYSDPTDPARARTIEVAPAERLDLGTLRVPEPSTRYELHGVVTDAAGAPVAGASVLLQFDGTRQATMPVQTAADGSFTLPVFNGQNYTVRAFHRPAGESRQQDAQGSLTLTISGPPSPIPVVLVVR